MKKSEVLYKAMLAVLRDTELSEDEKLEILTALIAERNLELWSEERAEKAAAEKAAAAEKDASAKDKEEA